MNLLDNQGLPVSGATAAGLAAYNDAARQLACLIDDPAGTIERAIAASPRMTMAHVLKAWVYLLGTEAAGVEVAREACTAAAALPADRRERAHLEAARALASGRWRDAAARLEDLTLRHPRDLLALQVGHQLDFFLGDGRMLRDRIARALPAWQPGMPGHHALLGMYAFGLEECGDYAAAEAHGQRAIELEERDSWAWHAVAHVHEMRQRPDDGIAWLAPNAARWAPSSLLATHIWWHLTLCHLEQDDHDAALRLYDASIGGTGSGFVLNLCDASSLLWRLHLRGVGVGERWLSLADRWQAQGVGHYAFNDLHAMIAFVGAGRGDAQAAVLDAEQRALSSDGDNAAFTREVGHAASLAVQAFGQGDHGRAAALLRPIRSQAHRFGGSHAQRDLIDLTLLEAALRSGDRALAAGLAAERRALRPASPLALRAVRRAQADASAQR